MSQSDFDITWIDSGREPQCLPDPAYPNGTDIPCSEPDARQICGVALPYPAQRCGLYVIRCKICDLTVAVNTVGRPDDPKSVQIACKSPILAAGIATGKAVQRF
jgi:hypothetical protein